MSVRKPRIYNEPALFAAIEGKDLKNGFKILEGPVPEWEVFGKRSFGNECRRYLCFAQI